VFGPFLSDPRCYYDASTNHFFMTILMFARDPATGAFKARDDPDRDEQDGESDDESLGLELSSVST
jgi:hypothetical protein